MPATGRTAGHTRVVVSDPPMADGWFGTQIALSGDTMLVAESDIGGRPGFVHVYVNRDERRTG
jgi:hypothetical protein